MSARSLRALTVTLLVGLGLLLFAPSADAHALLKASVPEQGATLDQPPETLTLTFTEEPEPSLADIDVLDQQGTSLVEGRAVPVPSDPRSLRVAVSEAPEGVYTVTWRVVSRVDGHATAGAFTFGVGVPPLDVAPTLVGSVGAAPDVSPLEVAGRWVLIIGLVAILGSAVIGIAAFGNAPGTVRRFAVAGGVVGLIGLIGLAAAQNNAAQVGLGTFLGTSLGGMLLWRAAGIGVALIGATVALRPGPRWQIALVPVAVGAAGAMLAEAAAGHAAAQSLPWVKIAAQWAHFAAAGIWIGGLAALLLGVRGTADQEKAAAVRRFSAVAGAALAVVVGTGVIRAINEVGGLGNLFSTSYGWVVITKVGLLLPLLALGATNRYRNVPRAGTNLGPLRRISRTELSVAAAVLVATAVLTSLAPPASAPSTRATLATATPLIVSGSDFATSVRVRLEVTPGTQGLNRFVATVSDFDTGEPIDARAVSLRFSFLDQAQPGDSTLALDTLSPGRYGAVGGNLSLIGQWRVAVLVQQPDDSVEVPLVVGTRCAAQPLGKRTPIIYSMELPEGGSVQGLVGGVGGNRHEVHFTFLRPGEFSEFRIPELDAIAALRAGSDDVIELGTKRLGPGHFVARTELEEGAWRFQAVTPTEGAAGRLIGCFEHTISA
ncbi:MAG: copper resistance protein CopC [Actinomycetota bacterium]